MLKLFGHQSLAIVCSLLTKWVIMPVKTDKTLILQASALIEQRTGLAASTQFRADLEGIGLSILGEIPVARRQWRVFK